MSRNILVVEDNDVNLELISLLIKEYNKANNENINIFTAVNGKEAVELCSTVTMDIVFMDLMMPVMNGNEATIRIKAHHPKTMIIVISAFGDEAKQKEMLNNGAEDYMMKPISAPLFKSRLKNYLQIIQNRNQIQNSPKAHNLFTTKVYHYNIDFSIASEADLCEFWDAILIRLDFQRHIDRASDFVRFLYRLGTFQLQQKFRFNILVEEDVENFFFTLNNTKLIGCEKINALIQSYYSEGVYLCKENLLTFKLSKSPLEQIDLSPAPVLSALEKEDEVHYATLNTSVLETNKNEILMTFAILDPDELEDFETNLIRLRSILLLIENSDLEDADIEELCHTFNEIASILSISNDTYILSNALHELSGSISANRDYFKQSASDLFDFVNAFVNDLVFWKTKIFYEGAPSVDFLNNSIRTNADMLSALLRPEEKGNEDLGDIFDF